jgi:hypothetical protein
MKERFTVFVNERSVDIYRGMKVKHALIALDYALYKACAEGQAVVRDGHGFIVGLDGALGEGAKLSIVASPSPSPPSSETGRGRDRGR